MDRTHGLHPAYVAIAFFLSLGGITFGLDSGGMSGFLAMPSFNRDFGTYDPQLKSFAISANRQLVFNLPALAFAVVCSLSAGEIASRFGRRGGYVALGLTSGVGAALQLGATNVSTLIAGKIINGGVYGLGSAMVPMYLSETAPAVVRGMLVSLLQLSINTGQLLATAINWGTHDLESRWAYRGPFLADTLVPAIVLVGIWFIPETPRYLLLKGRREAAVSAFRTFRGQGYPDELIQEEVEAIACAIEEEKQVAKSDIAWAALFQGSNARRTSICCLLFVCQQYSGISFLTSYGTYFFVLCGIQNSWMISFVLNVMGVGGTIASIFLLKFFGRRPIMLVGGVMQCISMFTFAIVGVAAPGSQTAARCLAAFTLLYEFFYSASWGPLGFVLAAEIASTELRAKTLALATAVNWACTLSLAAWLPYALNPVIGNLGTKLGFIFGPFIGLGTIWMYFYLPETSGRTLEQLDELFVKRVPARKSASHQYESGKAVPASLREDDEKQL